MMELIFLGTGGAQPTLERSTTCICLVKDGEILMFDAGEGAQISYLKSNLGWNKKMKIFVTHLHGDHCCLLYTSPSPRDRSLSRMPSSA